MIQPVGKPLYVVTAISNPVRYKSRYKLYREFAKRVEDSGAILYTIELAFGDRQFEITERGNIRHDQVRTFHELWHKENLLNLAIANLPADWEYVAWVDADVSFMRPDWVEETIHQLQHHMFIQMFANAIDLGPRGEPIKTHEGFVKGWYDGKLTLTKYYEGGHPGFAWAARREALDYVGGLIDWAVLGSGDRHMAAALVGQAGRTLNRDLSKNYKDMILEWQARAEKYILHDVGYMDGTLFHHWHGKKADRRYVDRWKILTENKFDPHLDLKRDSQGVYQLTDRNLKLRDDIRRYFRARNEDSIDL
jgi:hypothetical protein